MKKVFTVISCFAAAAGFCGILFLLQKLLVPKFVSDVPEGSMIEEYYREPSGHDVIFLGDCEAYECFDPSYIKKKTGLSCYVRGSASQRIWQSYYLAEDTFRYETPKYMVLSVQEMQYDTPAKEEYNRMTLDGMRPSNAKWDSVRASMNKGESFMSYVFPILRYHDRWRSLMPEDAEYMFTKPIITEHGFLPSYSVVPMGELPPVKALPSYKLPDKNMDYLDKLNKLCKSRGTTLILVKSPVLYPHWYDAFSSEIREFADKNGIIYTDMTNSVIAQAIGIDWSKDTADGGSHMNYNGAVQISSYFSDILLKLENEPQRNKTGVQSGVFPQIGRQNQS